MYNNFGRLGYKCKTILISTERFKMVWGGVKKSTLNIFSAGFEDSEGLRRKRGLKRLFRGVMIF